MSNDIKLWKQTTQEALRKFSDMLAESDVMDMPQAHDALKLIDKWAETTKRRVKENILLYISANGVQKTEKGTLEAVLGDYIVRAIPTSTSPDTDKLEKLLRAKGVENPQAYFEKRVTYKATRQGLDILVAQGILTEEEAKAVCEPSESRLEVKERQE